MASPFEILGVDPDASEDEVSDAYRELVKEVHPDQGGSTEEFRAVQRAYERIQSGYEPGDEIRPAGTAGPQAERATVDKDAEEEDEQSEPEGVKVEFLDYEAIESQGWQLTDDDLFEKAADGELGGEAYGYFYVEENETLLEAAEDEGYAWPFACRGGACTNCAVAVVDGEMPSPASHILPQDLHDRGIRLSCIAAPTTDAKIVYNVKHLPAIRDLLLPASRFEQTSSTD